jgi:hypothetical protein
MPTFDSHGSVVTAPTNGAPVGTAPEPQPEPPTPVLDPQPVTIDPEPVVPADPEPEVIENPGAEVVAPVPEMPVLDADWRHDRFEFRGELIGIRRPAEGAYAPVQIAGMGHTQPGLSERLTVRFLEMHIGPESYERMLCRAMDPDEPDFTMQTFGELIRVMSALKTADVDKGDNAEGES